MSWQWIVGSFSNKKYYDNQQNINTYYHTNQEYSFLDDEFESLSIPSQLNNYQGLTQYYYLNPNILQAQK